MLVLQEGQESQGTRQPTRTAVTALDHFMGTWSAEQEAEVLKSGLRVDVPGGLRRGGRRHISGPTFLCSGCGRRRSRS